MSVTPGVPNQPFIPASIERIASVKRRVQQLKLKVDVEVDGQINEDNLRAVLDAGANIIVCGTALFQGNFAANIAKMQAVLNEYESRD